MHDHAGWFGQGNCDLGRQPIISPTSGNIVCPKFDKKCLNSNTNFLLVTSLLVISHSLPFDSMYLTVYSST